MSLYTINGRYTYENFVVERVIDGDTVVLSIDQGFWTHRRKKKDGVSYRLYRINAPEMSTPEGPPARQALIDFMAAAVRVQTIPDPNADPKEDKYGRFLVELTGSTAGTEFNINDALVTAGQAVYRTY